jgi:hypothetical protein
VTERFCRRRFLLLGVLNDVRKLMRDCESGSVKSGTCDKLSSMYMLVLSISRAVLSRGLSW